MRIAIGADHAGFPLKEHLKRTLQRLGHAVDDHGTDSEAPVDYPPICVGRGARGRRRAGRPRHRLGGSGQGEQIAANKVPGVARGALQRSLYGAAVARAQRRQRPLDRRPHRRRSGSPTRSSRCGSSTPFEGGRHQRRIDQIAAVERRQTG